MLWSTVGGSRLPSDLVLLWVTRVVFLWVTLPWPVLWICFNVFIQNVDLCLVIINLQDTSSGVPSHQTFLWVDRGCYSHIVGRVRHQRVIGQTLCQETSLRNRSQPGEFEMGDGAAHNLKFKH